MSISIDVGDWSVHPIEDKGGLHIWVKHVGGAYEHVITIRPDGKTEIHLHELHAYFKEEQA